MPEKTKPPAAPSGHGVSHLPYVDVEAYNAELRDEEGFVGDRASNRAFRSILEDLRESLRNVTGEDPIGDEASEEISKKTLDKILTKGEPEAAGVVHGAIEGFASELATVTKRFLRQKSWKNVERIAVGGGLRASRVGELAIGRASVLIKEAGHAINLVPIVHDPDHAGLIGSVHLAPTWMFQGFGGVLAIDIGGSNIRVGIVGLGTKKTIDLADCEVLKVLLWRHRDEKPKPTRAAALARMVEMIEELVAYAEEKKIALAPFLGVGCPGVIEEDGSISKGAQNLPGNWESEKFNLPEELKKRVPKIGGHDTFVLLHNDAVVQGLSQFPTMNDVDHWGILTIGTGLGNACFFNHSREATKSELKAARAEAKAAAKAESEA